MLAVFFRGTGVLGCWLINELYSTVAVKVLDGVPLLGGGAISSRNNPENRCY